MSTPTPDELIETIRAGLVKDAEPAVYEAAAEAAHTMAAVFEQLLGHAEPAATQAPSAPPYNPHVKRSFLEQLTELASPEGLAKLKTILDTMKASGPSAPSYVAPVPMIRIPEA